MTELITVKRIWDRAPKCSFTGLVRFKDFWYCVLRESGEIRNDLDQAAITQGIVRVIGSPDGEDWESAAVFSYQGRDLRDPKITITPDQRMMVTSPAMSKAETEERVHMLAWYSSDGRQWSSGEPLDPAHVYLWRIDWHDGTAYSLNSVGTSSEHVRLYHSQDGRRFEVLCPNMFPDGYPDGDAPGERVGAGEHSLVFRSDGTCVCLLRRQDRSLGIAGMGLVGTSRPPYTDWQWKVLNERIAAPHMIELADGRLLAAVRLYQDRRRRTSLVWVDPQAGAVEECLVLPSSDHTSYAGVVEYAGVVWVSYHSSHESRAYAEPNIYLARVRV